MGEPAGGTEGGPVARRSGHLRYFNRELSWLKFNERVLDEARSDRNPVLERLKFLAITGSNLDEFFQVRVGGLKLLARSNPDQVDIAGMTAAEQLAAIREQAKRFYAAQYECLLGQLEPLLEQAGIRRLDLDSLEPDQVEYLRARFEEEYFAVCSPIAVNDENEFPKLTAASLALGIRLEVKASPLMPGESQASSASIEGEGRAAAPSASTEQHDRETSSEASSRSADERLVVLPIPRTLPRMISVPSESGYHYVPLELVLQRFAEKYFPTEKIVEMATFRVTRNADLALDEDGVSDLLAGMSDLLNARKTSDCVRLELSSHASDTLRHWLARCLNVADELIYACDGPIDLTAFFPICRLNGFESLRDKNWPPLAVPHFPYGSNVFDVLAAADRLLIHPYESYDPVIEFLQQAAADPDVIAIKQILYRTSRDSAIVQALIEAAENGKSVTVIVELKARFDEERNIHWARKLEQAGIDVIYGVQGLKTHAKLCMVVRREARGVRRYMHFGTGNYNESTAKLYSDVSLFTCDQTLGDDAISIFNAVTGLSVPQGNRLMAFSPVDLRKRLETLIDVETKNALNGYPARITAKFNSLSDQGMIDKFYEASRAGVQIRLNVRGICCLRPGVPGLSEHIEVVSIVDRFLEHARIFRFWNHGEPRVFISSADLMYRNLDKRVELLVPVEDRHCQNQLTRILETYFQDNVNAHELTATGDYLRRTPDGAEVFRSQEKLYQMVRDSHTAQRQTHTTFFEAHRGDG